MRTSLGENAARTFEHRDDRGLVVGAEDRAARVPDDAVVAEDRLERPVGRNRVQVRAEEERRSLRLRLDARIDVAEVVLVRLEAEVAQIARDGVRDGALVAGWARDGGELQKEVGKIGDG